MIDLTDEQLNRYIHEEILGLCSSCQFAMHSTHEDECVPFGSIPDYCNDLNLAAKAEAKVLESIDYETYIDALTRSCHYRAFCATARQRCEAMYSVMEEK